MGILDWLQAKQSNWTWSWLAPYMKGLQDCFQALNWEKNKTSSSQMTSFELQELLVLVNNSLIKTTLSVLNLKIKN